MPANFPVPPFEELTIVGFGIPGSGKTQFMAGDTKSMFAATEPGQGFIKARVCNIRSWGGNEYKTDPKTGHVTMSFKRLVHSIAEQANKKTLDISAVVIDIVDNLHVLCQDDVCAKQGIAHPSDGAHGKAWAAVNKEWVAWLRSLMDKVTVRFVSHCKSTEIEVENEKKVFETINRSEPTFYSNKAAQYLDGVVNAVGYFHTIGKNRHAVRFQQDVHTAAKDRTDILCHLGTIVLPSNPKLGFSHVAKLYREKAQEMGLTIQSL